MLYLSIYIYIYNELSYSFRSIKKMGAEHSIPTSHDNPDTKSINLKQRPVYVPSVNNTFIEWVTDYECLIINDNLLSLNQAARQAARQPGSQPASQPASQAASQPGRQSASQPARQPGSQPGRQQARQAGRQAARQPARQPASQPASCFSFMKHEKLLYQKWMVYAI